MGHKGIKTCHSQKGPNLVLSAPRARESLSVVLCKAPKACVRCTFTSLVWREAVAAWLACKAGKSLSSSKKSVLPFEMTDCNATV